MDVRSGIGWDSHRLVARDDPAHPAHRDAIVLGGVALEHPDGLVLAGHSDADVLAHAVCDALLGAVGLGDIGEHFPDSDPEFAGADSIALLAEAARRARAAGWTATYADATVVLERPKLGARRAEMRVRLAGALGIGPDEVNVKASTGERIGFVGREEGAAALAVVTVARVGR